MIQSPIGTNRLNATNPIDGFAWLIDDSGGGEARGAQIPGLGDTLAGVATFSEPQGPGTLPLIANFPGFGFQETITASPSQRSITIRFKITDCGFDCQWEGSFSMAANPEMDGKTVNNFGNSAYQGFAYLNHGLMLGQPEPAGCGGVDPGGRQTRCTTAAADSPSPARGRLFLRVFQYLGYASRDDDLRLPGVLIHSNEDRSHCRGGSEAHF